MANLEIIPVGRTSRIDKEGRELQIQTEYAGRPHPRLTTSVISSGQTIHKIQQDLEHPVADEDEKIKVERLLQRQHFQVLKIIENKDFLLKQKNGVPAKPINTDSPIIERLKNLEGVVGVYNLNNDGSFASPHLSKKFKQQFSPIFKNLLDVLNIFSELPSGNREMGVVAIEAQRLYLASSGKECFFILHKGDQTSREIEKSIQAALLAV